MNVFQGSSRRNSSLVVESNGVMRPGAPVRIPVSEGAIVTLQVNSLASSTASASFSYKVVGVPYNWYEKPFIGKSQSMYILFLVAFGIAVAILFISCPCFWVSIWGTAASFTSCTMCFGAFMGGVEWYRDYKVKHPPAPPKSKPTHLPNGKVIKRNFPGRPSQNRQMRFADLHSSQDSNDPYEDY